jgi:hypothetical protein
VGCPSSIQPTALVGAGSRDVAHNLVERIHGGSKPFV